MAAVVYTGSVHRFDVGSSQVSEEFLSVALSLTDQNLSVRIRATRDLSRLLTMVSLPAEQLNEIAMYNILVEREAIQGLFGYINGEKASGI